MLLSTRRPTPSLPTRRRLLTGLLGTSLLLAALVAPASSLAVEPETPNAELQPTIHYEDAQRHAQDQTEFPAGGRVTVGFAPRQGDLASVGGEAPQGLPAGRLSGRQLRTIGVVPQDVAAPTDITGTSTAGTSDLAAAVSPDGLRKEIFGFLPYWELTDTSTVLDYAKLSTIAFFGVGASAAGNLETSKNGAATVGWSGWTSARMTTVINDAHLNNTRVVLTVQSFAWSAAGTTKQKALLGSETARANLARQIATAVRDRGADGVNLDFEPLASGYDDEFVALVRQVRAEMDAVQPGYQLTFDTTGYIGNYPLEAATADGGADAIMVMGYDYRSAGSAKTGSIAPIAGPAYDIVDTILAYTARVPASKLILGVPYYGRAWSTDTDQLNATNISGTKNGASATVVYSTAADYLAQYGRRYDATEGTAWTVYRRQNCTATYGCVEPWRQLYVDDAEALSAKYDLVNGYGLRGVGIWALGYDGSRPELWDAIRTKFITDTVPPTAAFNALAASQDAESFQVTWTSQDDFAVASHDVDVSIDGGAWIRWISSTADTAATYLGARGHAFAFQVRARDHHGNTSAWSAPTTTTVTPAAIPAPGVGTQWFAIAPTRLLDTRSGNGLSGAFINAQPRTLQLSGRGSVPMDAVAVTANLTVTGATSAGYVAIGPSMTATPSTSTINLGRGQTLANGLTLRVAPDGTGSAVFRGSGGATAHVILDVTGYYRAGDGGATWYAMDPTRLLDTRAGSGLAGRFKNKAVRTVQIAGRGTIPPDAVAVTGNLTATGATGSGYVSIGPSMTSRPGTSTLNAAKGTTIANNLTLLLAADGKAGMVFVGASGTSVHLVFDVTGYYRAGDAGAEWYPVDPTRLLDTRAGNELAGAFVSAQPRTFQLTGRGSVPVDAVAVTANLTVTGVTAAGYVAIGPTMTSTPSTSTINLARGQTLANGLTLRVGTAGTVAAVFKSSIGATAHKVLDLVGYFR